MSSSFDTQHKHDEELYRRLPIQQLHWIGLKEGGLHLSTPAYGHPRKYFLGLEVLSVIQESFSDSMSALRVLAFPTKLIKLVRHLYC